MNYIVNENILMALLVSDYKLCALEEAGIGEKDWYEDAMVTFLERFTDDGKVPSFVDLAYKDLRIFNKVEED